MKKLLSIWIALMFLFSIALISGFMSKYGQLEPKDTPVEDILWVIWSSLWIVVPVYYVMMRSLKK